MSAAEWSGRRSDHVDPPDGVRPGQAPRDAVSGPESVPPPTPRTGAAERRGRVSAQQLRVVASELSDRDRTVLATVDAFGFLRTDQLQTLIFPSYASQQTAARICRRVLARLHRLRVIEPLKRRIGGIRAGSASYVWRVGPVGDRLQRLDPARPRARRKEPSTRFLQHRLAVADCVCALTMADRTEDLELLRVVTEPDSWRPFAGLHGAREILKPDLYAVTASGDYEDHWFIEIDRGTESLPTVLHKCDQYDRYRRSGREQAARGIFPRVLWLVPDDHRMQRVQNGIHANRDLDQDLFRVATLDAVLPLLRGGAS
jgi:hypothetical protein